MVYVDVNITQQNTGVIMFTCIMKILYFSFLFICIGPEVGAAPGAAADWMDPSLLVSSMNVFGDMRTH